MITFIQFLFIVLSNFFFAKGLLISERIAYFLPDSDYPKYKLTQLSEDSKIYKEHTQNVETLISNNFFYFIQENDTMWKNTIRNHGRSKTIIYIENLPLFYELLTPIRENNLYISAIIIGSKIPYENNTLINELQAIIHIFINDDQEEIKAKYMTYYGSSIIFENTFTADLISSTISSYSFLFYCFILPLWIFVHNRARKKKIKLFVHSFILFVTIILFMNSLFFELWLRNKKDEKNEEELTSGFIYGIFKAFLFLKKFFLGLFATIQVNIIELREHYELFKNSRVGGIFLAVSFFIMALENESVFTKEFFNVFYNGLIGFTIVKTFFILKEAIESRIERALLGQMITLPSLKLKKKTLIKHFIIICFYIIVFIVAYFNFTYYEIEIRTPRSVLTFINSMDTLLFIFLMIIHFPRKLPPQYQEDSLFSNQDFEIMFPTEIEPYNNVLTLDIKADENKYFENYQLDMLYDTIIVENPFAENKFEEKQKIKENNNKDDKNKDEEKKDGSKDNINNEKECVDLENSNDNIKNSNVSTEENNSKNNDVNINGEENEIEEEILDINHTKVGYIINEPLVEAIMNENEY